MILFDDFFITAPTSKRRPPPLRLLRRPQRPKRLLSLDEARATTAARLWSDAM